MDCGDSIVCSRWVGIEKIEERWIMERKVDSKIHIQGKGWTWRKVVENTHFEKKKGTMTYLHHSFNFFFFCVFLGMG